MLWSLAVIILPGCNDSVSTRLVTAVTSGSVGDVTAALNDGADPNASGEHGVPLTTVALRNKRFDIAETLISSGADAERKVDGVDILFVVVVLGRNCPVSLLEALLKAGKSAETAGPLGETPLIVGLELGSEECVSTLMRSGATITATTQSGETALHAAAIGSTGSRIDELIRAGLEVDARVGKDGDTPLMLAAASPNEGARSKGVVAALLAHDADPCLRNKNGDDAAAIALRYGANDQAQMLKVACENVRARAKQ
jgi:ankyrin repeat protein